MNAYELADEIDNFLKEEEQLPWGTKQVYLDMASTMIRQQAKRIEELEEQVGTFEKALMQSRIEKSLAIADRNRLTEELK